MKKCCTPIQVSKQSATESHGQKKHLKQIFFYKLLNFNDNAQLSTVFSNDNWNDNGSVWPYGLNYFIIVCVNFDCQS